MELLYKFLGNVSDKIFESVEKFLDVLERNAGEISGETPESIKTSAGISGEIAARIPVSNNARISGGVFVEFSGWSILKNAGDIPVNTFNEILEKYPEEISERIFSEQRKSC